MNINTLFQKQQVFAKFVKSKYQYFVKSFELNKILLKLES